MNYGDFLVQKFFNNTVEEYLQALALFVVLVVVFRVFRSIVLARFKTLALRTATQFDDHLVEALEAIHPRFYDFIALYIAFHKLFFVKEAHSVLDGIFLAVIIVQVIISSQKVIEYFLHRMLHDKTHDEAGQMMFGGLSMFIKLTLWGTGFLLFLSNMGVNIVSLTTGLGIGGIAVALAVQNILGDIFSSFSIYFDKPFRVGDFIIVGADMGEVERIGLKSTRLRALQGEEIIISNKELTAARIQNFKRMKKRRILFTLGVVYSTSLEQCKLIPEIIARIFEEMDNADLDRVNFLEFAASSLNFEIVYYHLSGDYTEYMRVRERVNLRIKEEFEKAGIEFAYPTQTLVLERKAKEE